ncbi:MAG: hypothetical protein ACE5DM_02700 [Candidatus Nanoarchaeia archaeon]
MDKKAIQLSINFIVMLILGISMFAMGLVFVNKFFSGAKDIKGSMDAQTDRQIEAMLDSGSSFVIPIHSKIVHRKEYATYGVGIFNDGRSESTQFAIELKFESAFDKRNMPLCSGGCSENAKPIIKPGLIQDATIQKGEKYKFLIVADVPAKTQSGTYIYTVKSKQGGIEYEPSLQLIVKVK